MKSRAGMIAVALLVSAGIGYAGQPAGPAAALKNLPPSVRATVEAETRGATIKGISKEAEKGKTVYEVESIVNGRTRDFMVDAAGKVYLVEEQLDVDKAPAPVRRALETQGTIVGLESVTEHGVTTFEGRVKTRAGKSLSIEVDAAGQPVKR